LEFNEFHDMMKTTLDGTTRWEKLKKAHTPPDTWKAFKVRTSYSVFKFIHCSDTFGLLSGKDPCCKNPLHQYIENTNSVSLNTAFHSFCVQMLFVSYVQ